MCLYVYLGYLPICMSARDNKNYVYVYIYRDGKEIEIDRGFLTLSEAWEGKEGSVGNIILDQSETTVLDRVAIF
jgi:hypothetical protein